MRNLKSIFISNKNLAKLILISILICICMTYLKLLSGIHYKRNIVVKNGAIDLSSANFSDIMSLDGKWEFYPNEFKDNKFLPKYYMNVPSKWNNCTYGGKKLGTYGKGTYRVRIKLPKSGMYCFNIRFISSAYKIFVDNKEIISNGSIGSNYDMEVATWKPQIIPFYASSKEIEVIIEVSNYHHNKGGIINSIVFGNYDAVSRNWYANLFKSAFMIGIFAGLGFYLILLYKSKQKKNTYIYLGLFCLSSLVLESIVDVNIIYCVFKDISFNVISKLEYLSYMGVIIALSMFVKSVYSKEFGDLRFKLITLINFLYTLIIIVTPVKIFASNDVIYVIMLILNISLMLRALIKAAAKKCKFSMLLLNALIILIVTVVIDFLYTFHFANIHFTSNNYILGLLFLLSCQIYILSVEVMDAFEESGRAKDMEIAFLQAQISPHFFFNTLNNIYCLMNESVPKAKNLILDFSDFLRVKHKFDYRKNVLYPLDEEIDLIEAYVRIQNIRFDNLINLVVDISEEYMDIKVPPLLFQPVVENSIKHGLGEKAINIMIAAFKKKDRLQIVISDDGKGINKDILSKLFDEEESSSGVGLKNINFRLKKCYNTELKIESEEHTGTKIYFEIPLEG